MAPNTDYEYGVAFDRKNDNASSGVRYIGRSEMVEFVCHGDEPQQRKPSAKARPKSGTKQETKFARVKSPRMRRKAEADDELSVDAAAVPVKPRKRCVTFNLDAPDSYPVVDVPSLPPIEQKPATPEVNRKSYGKQTPLKKARSLDEASMTRLVPLGSPTSSPMTSPKLSRRSSFTTANNRKQEPLSVDSFSPRSTENTPRKRFERVDSMLKKLESLNGSKESLRSTPEMKRRSPPASPKSPRSDKNLFVNLDNIDDYKPEKGRLKFIQAALSSTTSPRFVRPGSGDSSKSSDSRRSSPVSVAQISLDGDHKSRMRCSFPELDASSNVSSSRSSSPCSGVFSPPNTRVSTASSGSRSPRRGSATKTRATIQETITTLLSQNGHKWYD